MYARFISHVAKLSPNLISRAGSAGRKPRQNSRRRKRLSIENLEERRVMSANPIGDAVDFVDRDQPAEVAESASPVVESVDLRPDGFGGASGPFNQNSGRSGETDFGGATLFGVANEFGVVAVQEAKSADANDDGLVDAADQTLLANGWGAQKGDPHFDPRADFNGDGAIDAADYTVFANQFGTKARDHLAQVRHRMVDLAKTDLAKQLGVPKDEIKVTGMENVIWSDSSLGVPKPGGVYLQVLTPGFQIELSHEGSEYTYHTDRDDTVVLATDLPDNCQKQQSVRHRMVDLAKTDLAEQLGVPKDEIKVTGMEKVIWEDGSLGVHRPLELVVAHPVRGFRIMLAHDGAEYTYHTDRDDTVVLATDLPDDCQGWQSVRHRMIDLAKTDLAEQIGVPKDEIKVAGMEKVTWNDSSLGAPQPGYFYSQVLTPGFRIELLHDGSEYTYHTDRDDTVVLAGLPEFEDSPRPEHWRRQVEPESDGALQSTIGRRTRAVAQQNVRHRINESLTQPSPSESIWDRALQEIVNEFPIRIRH